MGFNLSWLGVRLIFVCITWVGLLTGPLAFSSRSIISRPQSLTSLNALISFKGDSSGVLNIDASLESVQDFLQSPASDLYLLGTDSGVKRNDGLWDCQQPIIDFLGITLQPVFVNRLDRQPDFVSVSIVDARTNILKNPQSLGNRAVSNLMSNSKFIGKSIISAKSLPHTNDSPGCQVELKLNLTLEIPLPTVMRLLLPPGFNSLGSAIVRKTGNSRTKKLLKDLEVAFLQHCKTEKISSDSSTENLS